jgi:hypothetical protein
VQLSVIAITAALYLIWHICRESKPTVDAAATKVDIAQMSKT